MQLTQKAGSYFKKIAPAACHVDNSCRTLGPPETLRHIEGLNLLSTQFLSIPLVTNRQSARGASGEIVFWMSSRPVVGPWKYP